MGFDGRCRTQYGGVWRCGALYGAVGRYGTLKPNTFEFISGVQSSEPMLSFKPNLLLRMCFVELV